MIIFIYKKNKFIKKMKTIIDVINESMNDEYAELKRCKNVGEFVCTLVGISDLSDFDEDLYDDIDTTDNSVPFDQGDFKSTKKWIESYKNAQVRDVRVKYDRTMDVISCKVANKRYTFNIQK